MSLTQTVTTVMSNLSKELTESDLLAALDMLKEVTVLDSQANYAIYVSSKHYEWVRAQAKGLSNAMIFKKKYLRKILVIKIPDFKEFFKSGYPDGYISNATLSSADTLYRTTVPI